MLPKKVENIVYSLAILAAYACIVRILIVKDDRSPGEIAAFYFWAIATILLAGLGGLIVLALRLFNKIDLNRNLMYVLFGVANIAIGLIGVLFYYFHTINIIGLRDVLPSLLLGIVIITDIFVIH